MKVFKELKHHKRTKNSYQLQFGN